jgi:hypothetical protein
MNQTNVSKNAPKSLSKSNGSPSMDATEHPEQPVAAANIEPAAPAQAATSLRMVSISLPPGVHTKLKLLSSLTDRSISDIATEAVTKVIQAELRAALAKVDLDG